MARGSTRGVQAGMVLLTVSAPILAGAGFYVGSQGGNPWWWWYAAIACVVLAALLPIVFWGILPRLRGEGAEESSSDGPTKITVRETPEGVAQNDKFQERPLEVEVENPPDNLTIEVGGSKVEKQPDKINIEKPNKLTLDSSTTDDEDEAENGGSQE